MTEFNQEKGQTKSLFGLNEASKPSLRPTMTVLPETPPPGLRKAFSLVVARTAAAVGCADWLGGASLPVANPG